jgi:hypothetical protein
MEIAMTDYTEHELALMELMSDQNKQLMPKLNSNERKSMETYVTTENLAEVEKMIGTDEEIEHLLFWDRGGKFDNAEWNLLRPFSPLDQQLMKFMQARLQELKKQAVEIQRRSDLTLYSQFNEGLLFTGISGAVRCNDDGADSSDGSLYRGVELRMIGSTRNHCNTITIIPAEEKFKIHYGPRAAGKGIGNTVNSGDAFTLIQLAQMLEKDFEKAGVSAMLIDSTGIEVQLEAKTIRRAAKKGEALPYESTLTLVSENVSASMEAAFELACSMCRVFYERFGLETEVFNLGRQFGNFTVSRNEDFEQFMDTVARSGKKGLVFLTATLVCRRCRREVDGFAIMAERYPDVQFALVNMNAPHGKFHERVFGDLAGGDPDQFVQVAKGVTPFTIVYTADGQGELEYREYFATGKTMAPPTPEFACSVLDKYFRRA